MVWMTTRPVYSHFSGHSARLPRLPDQIPKWFISKPSPYFRHIHRAPKWATSAPIAFATASFCETTDNLRHSGVPSSIAPTALDSGVPGHRNSIIRNGCRSKYCRKIRLSVFEKTLNEAALLTRKALKERPNPNPSSGGEVSGGAVKDERREGNSATQTPAGRS